MEARMKKEFLKYLSGLCQAASAALLAAAMIMPAMTAQALWGCCRNGHCRRGARNPERKKSVNHDGHVAIYSLYRSCRDSYLEVHP
jgi:hypothetical protein